MPSSRIFVSYACIGDEQGARIGKRLVSDIRATQTEAVTDHETISDEHFMDFLNRELPQCGYLIVVQTPVAMRSLRVQSTVNMALTLVAHQRMRGILRVIAVPSEDVSDPLLWSKLVTFDASADYLRARDKIFLELGLISLDPNDSFYSHRPPMPAPRPNAPVGSNFPAQPSGPMPGPVRSNFPPQASGPMPRPVGSNFPPQPSGPMPAPRPVGSNWSPQPSGAIPAARPVGSNWPAQPPGPPPRPAGSNWPSQPAGPRSRPTRPAYVPESPVKNAGSTITGLFARRWKTSQISIAAPPAEEIPTLRDDRPLPLENRRQTLIYWLIVSGIALLLALGIALAIVLWNNHLHSVQPHTQHVQSMLRFAGPFF